MYQVDFDIRKLAKTVMAPVERELPFFVACLVLMALPTIIQSAEAFYWRSALRTLLGSICSSTVMAYLLCFVLPRADKARRMVKGPIYVAIYALSFSELFLLTYFGTTVSPFLLQLLQQTNSSEAGQFLATYIFSKSFLPFVLGGIAIVACNALMERYRHRIRGFGRLRILVLVALVCCLPVFGLAAFRTLDYLITGGNTPQTSGLTIGRLITSVKAVGNDRMDFDRMDAAMKSIGAISRTGETTNVVLIIGESHSKLHSSLYGYEYDTEPLAVEQRNIGNLYPFTDCVTPYNYTSMAMRLMLSLANTDNGLYWADTPIVSTLFSHAGYRTILLSNQEVAAGQGDLTDYAAGSFLTRTGVFDLTNRSLHRYDSGLIDDLNDIAPDLEQPNFIIFRLMGQHNRYSYRYPDTAARFTPEDYASHGKTSTEREYIAHYDNATLYTDQVIRSIIELFESSRTVVVYLSDHGEEVNDYRTFVGRSHEAELTPDIVRCQYEIPMWIWMSDQYMASQPRRVEQIATSTSRAWMSDDLPHLLLDLAGINSEWFQPQRSVINPCFDSSRKRLLRAHDDYDKIMQNSRPTASELQ